MFGFEYDEQEEREALLEAGYQRGFARGFAHGFADGFAQVYANDDTHVYYDDMIRERIIEVRKLIAEGVVTMHALKESGCYSQEELNAIAKPL